MLPRGLAATFAPYRGAAFSGANFAPDLTGKTVRMIVRPTISGKAVRVKIEVGYIVIVTRRARRQTGYRPVLEDWVGHTAIHNAWDTVIYVAIERMGEPEENDDRK